MRAAARSASRAFAAGAVGALVNSLAAWSAARAGLFQALGVALAPSLTPAWLYPRITWGGLFGLLLLLPSGGSGSWVRRGLLVSLAPTLFQLLYVFPVQSGRGLLGVELGALTPVAVLVLNAIWGIAAAGWLRFTGRS